MSDSSAVYHGMFLFEGYVVDHATESSFDNDGGVCGAAAHLEPYAAVMAEIEEAVAKQYSHDFPGVYAYEVTNLMGHWLYDNRTATMAEFREEAMRRSVEFFTQMEDR